MFGGFRGVSAYELNGETEIDESLFSLDRPDKEEDFSDVERKEIKITYFYEKDPKTVIIRPRLRTLKIEESTMSANDPPEKRVGYASKMDVPVSQGTKEDGASKMNADDSYETSTLGVPTSVLEHRDSCELARKRKTSKESDMTSHDSSSEDEDIENVSILVRRTSFVPTPVTIPNEIENTKSPSKKPLKPLSSILRRKKNSNNKDTTEEGLSETKPNVETNSVNSTNKSTITNNAEEVGEINTTVKKTVTLTTEEVITQKISNNGKNKENGSKSEKGNTTNMINEPPKPPPRIKKLKNQKDVQNSDEPTKGETLV